MVRCGLVFMTKETLPKEIGRGGGWLTDVGVRRYFEVFSNRMQFIHLLFYISNMNVGGFVQ